MIAVAPAGAADADMLSALHAAAFPAGWRAADLAVLLDQPGALALTAREDGGDGGDGAVGGFVLARIAAGEAEILTLAVVPAARRRGIASALMHELIAALEARGVGMIHLEVAAANAPARALYAAFGFARTGRREAYYRAPGGGAGDALVLARALTDGAGADGSHAPQNPV